MELKQGNIYGLEVNGEVLLIVPYGIETLFEV